MTDPLRRPRIDPPNWQIWVGLLVVLPLAYVAALLVEAFAPVPWLP